MGVLLQVHLHSLPRVRVEWYPVRPGGSRSFGVIELDEVRLFLDSEQLDALSQAVEALQRERDERPA